jgi:hypothetical protein
MLVLGWFAVLLVLATLWADGAFAKIDWRSVRTYFRHSPARHLTTILWTSVGWCVAGFGCVEGIILEPESGSLRR